jgi:methionine-rich copper-binding protein CopC
MRRVLALPILYLAATSAVAAASATNSDPAPVTAMVTQTGERFEVTIAPGETIEFCRSGCYLMLPNGDRQALAGTETIEISGGVP